MLLIPAPTPPARPSVVSPNQAPLPGLSRSATDTSEVTGSGIAVSGLPRAGATRPGLAATQGGHHTAAARAATLMRSFGVLVVEVWQGRRPPHQLDHAMAPHLALAVLADSQVVPSPQRLVRVHACVVSRVVIEGAVVVALGPRVASLTMRLERGLNTWWCSHYHLLRSAHRREPAHDPQAATPTQLA